MMFLSPEQVEMLIRLDDGPTQDSVGLKADTLGRSDLECLRILYDKGLVLIDVGWLKSVWFRLSPEGRIVKANALFS
ncbi:hypothetical protein ASG43_08860 [Aureimonas sp. Leaf454]|nr:hypothetical protein ASG43_08860 [Aureimonas sp. Leaf454]